MSHVELLRVHFLDQTARTNVPAKATKQAAFKKHTDKSKQVKPGETLPWCSVLATVVVRIGGEGASALRVVGFGNASLDEVGGARAFASCLWHETAVQGGLKVAFFVGYAFPHVDERRMRRFQDPWNVVKDVD